MRVLLPLRKLPASKQSSTDNLPELENAETLSVSSTCPQSSEGEAATTSALRLEFQDLQYPTGQLTFSLNLAASSGKATSELQQFALLEQHNRCLPLVERGAWKTTGLHTAAEPDQKRPGVSPRKRPRPSGDDSRKRPAIEKKPPAKPSASMGLGPAGRKGSTSNSYLFDGNSSSRGSIGRALVTRNPVDDGEDPAMESSPESSSRMSTNVARSPDEESHDIFVLELKKRGLEMREQDGDGNCLFRAVSLQVYGDPSMHGQVRHQCLDFMVRCAELFCGTHFFASSWEARAN
jgi:hypothetical protein